MSDRGREQLRLLLTGALYVVSTAAVLRAILVLIENPMAGAVLGAAAVSLIAARADVQTERFVSRARKRVLWGVGIAIAAVVAGVTAVLATGGTFEVSGASTAALFGIAEAVGLAYSREMLLRGIPLTFAKRAGVADRHAFTFAAMAGVAFILLEPNAKPMGLVLTAAASAAFTALWIRTGDGHASIAAHVVWIWLTDAALTGDLLQLSGPSGNLTTRPNASGAGAIAAAAAFAVATVLILVGKLPLEQLRAKDFPEPEGDDREPPRPAKRRRKRKGSPNRP